MPQRTHLAHISSATAREIRNWREQRGKRARALRAEASSVSVTRREPGCYQGRCLPGREDAEKESSSTTVTALHSTCLLPQLIEQVPHGELQATLVLKGRGGDFKFHLSPYALRQTNKQKHTTTVNLNSKDRREATGAPKSYLWGQKWPVSEAVMKPREIIHDIYQYESIISVKRGL